MRTRGPLLALLGSIFLAGAVDLPGAEPSPPHWTVSGTAILDPQLKPNGA